MPGSACVTGDGPVSPGTNLLMYFPILTLIEAIRGRIYTLAPLWNSAGAPKGGKNTTLSLAFVVGAALVA